MGSWFPLTFIAGSFCLFFVSVWAETLDLKIYVKTGLLVWLDVALILHLTGQFEMPGLFVLLLVSKKKSLDLAPLICPRIPVSHHSVLTGLRSSNPPMNVALLRNVCYTDIGDGYCPQYSNSTSFIFHYSVIQSWKSRLENHVWLMQSERGAFQAMSWSRGIMNLTKLAKKRWFYTLGYLISWIINSDMFNLNSFF